MSSEIKTPWLKNYGGIPFHITYPEGNGLTYQYQKDNGSWETATQSQQVEFTESGTLVAKVSDGTNEESSTYSVEIYNTSGSDLVDKAGTVTSGDGLYADSYESNVYTYRGSNPNNYVTFNRENWRIISVNTSDNTIKIIRSSVLEDRIYDNTRSTGGYCNYSYCNIWGSSSTLYNASLSPITTLAREVGGTAYALPNQEADVNEYLNTTYYNGLNATARSMIKSDAVYKAGVLKYQSGQATSTDISQVSATKWKGKVGLIDATEYVRASTNSSCTGAYAYWNNSSCYSGGGNNWLYISDLYWTMSPYSDVSITHGVRPVVTLSPNVKITGGDGSSTNAYQLSL